MKKSLVPLLLLATGLSACTTVEFVRRDLVPTKQAVLRYPPTSSEQREEKARAELADKGRDFCKGDFKIDKEFEARDESGNSTGFGVGTGFGLGGRSTAGLMLGTGHRDTEMYHFVEISCL